MTAGCALRVVITVACSLKCELSIFNTLKRLQLPVVAGVSLRIRSLWVVIHSVRQPHPLTPAVATKAFGRTPSAAWTLDPLSAQAQGSLCTATLRHDGGTCPSTQRCCPPCAMLGSGSGGEWPQKPLVIGIFLHGIQPPKMMVEENESIVNKETRNYRLKNLPSKSLLVS